MGKSLELSATAQRAFDGMAADLMRVFGSRFVALVAYAADRGAAFSTTLESGDLDALSMLTEGWHRSGLATPLLLTSDEFTRSLDAFPLEYQAIMQHHVVIAGTPPFAGSSVHAEELRRACETQAKGHLIHLRQTWVDAAGHGSDLAQRLSGSAMPLRMLISHVAALDGQPDADPATFAATRFGPDAKVLASVLALEHDPAPAKALLAQLPQYLSACEHIWAFVDAWHA